MHYIQFVYFAAVLLVATAAITEKKMAPLLAADSKTAIENNYIVVFDDNIQEKDVQRHHILLSNMMAYYNNSAVKNHFHIGSFRGYSAILDNKLLYKVQSMSGVQYVERDQVVTALCTLQTSATWGIVRTTERENPTVYDYSYNENDGEGVDVYIIDTGIDIKHEDFGGRAKWGVDYIDNPSPETDPHGHGTHCAGTVMANTWGLAKKATSIAVRVLNANGSGSTAGVISGVNWVANQHGNGKKSVANMSLGGGKSTSMNSAVTAAVSAGVHFAIAAGNEAQSACNVSPASACDTSSCMSVAASDSSDQIAYFSNYGTCVDIIGPGVAITSTWKNGGTNTISGTSMAAPHVAGVMAKYLTTADYTPAELKAELVSRSTEDKITGLTGSKSSTPNKLVFKDCGSGDENDE